MQSGTTSVTATQTDADAHGLGTADPFVDCGHLNKHFANGHATPPDLHTANITTDRSMLLPPEHTANGFLASGIVTYKAKMNGGSYDFNSTSSTTIGSVSGAGGGGSGAGGAGSSIASSLCHCCNLIARRCIGINVRRCVLALFAITVVSIFYYTHYVGTDVFDG
ncbi:bifunctional heparan sulfate N-deacetylase/N-sulfotransferase-like [Drosophila novamexicana]|uniref:bifunctional heparan sulfate N-deacetylase/N-sulfotransferase-like n=1 Tax=Drosophila novamexicana TaxID=47314 RepID=UPI0011E5DEFD|nr:bifunctional heparan sulfate N-deacetylase/N-sulfotransferase-like [Drosophila novamexicana]